MSEPANRATCTVIIPMDRPGPDAQRAVAAVLAQGPRLLELIVVAGRSVELPRDPRVRLRVVEERNPAIRRNKAAAEAKGEYLAFIDDDAFAAENWLERAAAFLDDNPGVLAVGGPDPAPADSTFAELISDTLLAARWIGSGVAAHESRRGVFHLRSPHDVALVNMVVRREAFAAVGGFDAEIGYIGEDTALVELLMDHGRVVFHDGVVVAHRRRAFPGAYVRQRWRYRVKTGRLLVSAGKRYRSPRVIAFLLAGLIFGVAAVFAPKVAAGMLAFYFVLTLALGAAVTRLRPSAWILIPFAFMVHHATYFFGICWGLVTAGKGE
ncbi:MAG: glycosyltransferase [Thermoanaerobaculia bacterium]|nr:glycosyltransferase [Thermoanaerobaculia bacterium]